MCLIRQQCKVNVDFISKKIYKNDITYLKLIYHNKHILSPSPKVRSDLIPSPPTYNTKYGYLSWESYINISYYTRLLPPVPEDCPLPMGTKGGSYTTIPRQLCC